MAHHILKTHPPMFRAVRDGVKNFEVRKDDRAFQAGDTVELTYHESDAPMMFQPPFPKDDARSPIKRKVTFVLRGGQYGIEPGYVVLALTDVDA